MQDFDLSLACALGACSFEAYHIAYHMHGLKVLAPSPMSTSQSVHLPFMDSVPHLQLLHTISLQSSMCKERLCPRPHESITLHAGAAPLRSGDHLHGPGLPPGGGQGHAEGARAQRCGPAAAGRQAGVQRLCDGGCWPQCRSVALPCTLLVGRASDSCYRQHLASTAVQTCCTSSRSAVTLSPQHMQTSYVAVAKNAGETWSPRI